MINTGVLLGALRWRCEDAPSAPSATPPPVDCPDVNPRPSRPFRHGQRLPAQGQPEDMVAWRGCEDALVVPAGAGTAANHALAKPRPFRPLWCRERLPVQGQPPRPTPGFFRVETSTASGSATHEVVAAHKFAFAAAVTAASPRRVSAECATALNGNQPAEPLALQVSDRSPHGQHSTRRRPPCFQR